MKKIVLLGLVAVFISSSSWAQYNFRIRQKNQSQSQSRSQSQKPDRRLFFGVGGGFGIGTTSTTAGGGGGIGYNYYSVLPFVGYRITDQASIGVSYTYQRYNYPSVLVNYTQYGYGPFFRYNINPVFVQAEYDIINAPTTDTNGSPIRSNFSRMLFGLGYVFVKGRVVSLGGLVMYDVLYHVPSVFNSPLVTRVYLTF